MPSIVHSRTIKAFTLLELAIVLVLISLVAGGALVVFTASVQQRQYNDTIATMQVIDDALLRFRLTNNRLPCPADITIAPGNTNYGVEMSTINTSGSPAFFYCGINVSYLTSLSATAWYEPVTEGAVPTRALGLPDSYMYDGWGNHIRYAVDDAMAVSNAFSLLETSNVAGPVGFYSGIGPIGTLEGCNSITICDSGGYSAASPPCVNTPPRSSTAIYALISQGASHHGAITQNPALDSSGLCMEDDYLGNNCPIGINTGSLNVDKLENCHCTSSGLYNGSYDGTYVQHLPAYTSGNAGNPLYYFDDIVTFKERWQLQSPQDSNNPVFLGDFNQGSPFIPTVSSVANLVVVGGSKIYYYQQLGSVFTKQNNVTSTITSINAVAFYPNNQYIIVGGTAASGVVQIWYWSSPNTLTYFPTDLNVLNTTTAKGVGISKNGRFLVVSFSKSPYLSVGAATSWYNISSDFQGFGTIAYTTTTLPAAGGTVAFSPDGKYLAVVSGTATPTLLVYGVNCTTITYLTGSPSLPAGITAVSAVSFSNDDKYMALSATVSGAAKILVYKNVGGTFSLAATLIPPGSNTSATGVAFSHNGNTLVAVAQGGSNTPYIYFYTNNRDDTFTAFANPVSIGAGATATGVAWSKDDQFVAVSDGATDTGGTGYAWDGVALYQVVGTTVNPLPAVASPPNTNMSAVAFAN